jgi:hypothetical protein
MRGQNEDGPALPVAGGPRPTEEQDSWMWERNGNYRHGHHTKERRAIIRAIRKLVHEVKDLTQTLRGAGKTAHADRFEQRLNPPIMVAEAGEAGRPLSPGA